MRTPDPASVIASTPVQIGSSGTSPRTRSRNARVSSAPRSRSSPRSTDCRGGRGRRRSPARRRTPRRAAGPVRLDQRAKVPRLPAADRGRLAAARMERAAERRVGRVRHLTARQVARYLAAGVGIRDRAQQRLRVRVPGVGEDLLGRPDLDDPAEVHDRDPVAEVLRAGQVVGDVDVGQSEVLLEVEHQLEDLRAHRHVEHRDRLVRDQHARAGDDRARDDDALLLPAGQVARVLLQEQLDRRQPDPLERVDDLRAAFARGAHAVHAQGVADRLLHGHRRVEGGVRVLEHHLDVLAERAQPAPAQLGEVLVLERDRAGGGRGESEERAAQGRLPASALPDQPHDLAAPQLQVDAVDGLDGAGVAAEQPRERSPAEREVHGEVPDVDDGVGAGRRDRCRLRLRRQRPAPPASAARSRRAGSRPADRPASTRRGHRSDARC